MERIVQLKKYPEPEICRREILRYAGCRASDSNQETEALLEQCLAEVRSALTYSVCWLELPCTVRGEECDFGEFSVHSASLAANLAPCRAVILFAATVGIALDRLILRHSRLSPAKALLFQAIGAERIEALCDAFCAELAEQQNGTLRPRFSPGYGDLPLELQREVFRLLDCPKHIGLSLSDRLLMSPTKSVTAFVGIVDQTK